MKAITLTVLIVFLFTSTSVRAQDSTQAKKQERYFRKFWVEFGAGGIRFVGKKDPSAEQSVTGINSPYSMILVMHCMKVLITRSTILTPRNITKINN